MQHETYTIGQIFARSAHALYEDLDFVACDFDDLSRNMTIRIRPSDVPIGEFVAKTVDHAIEKLRAIRAAL